MTEAAARSHGRVPTRESRPLAGIACMLVGVALLTLSDAAVIAPFKFTNMVWGVIFGFVVWGHLPDRWVVGGSLLVIASGLCIFYREHRLGQINKAPQSA